LDSSDFDPRRLPYVTDARVRIGGILKREPRHFVVEEMPLYEPRGEGEHVYVRLRREGRTTAEVIDDLARSFGLRARDIGCAGQKDKLARATQTFSLPLGSLDPDEAARRVAGELGIEVLWARRHTNKLRRGHLLGNRFDVLIEHVDEDAFERARAIARAIAEQGLANYYGPQRFGADAENARRGRALLSAPRGDGMSRFLLSAFQSMLFNGWLVERMRREGFDRIWRGDVAKRLDNGALFDVADANAENARMSRCEITYTGPIFGARMRRATDVAGELERTILREFDVQLADLARARLDGSRRAGRIFVADLEILPEGASLRARFSLPKGSYATVLLRELMKSDGLSPDIDPAE
jgi:tRNA pseudouridine13 synthase